MAFEEGSVRLDCRSCGAIHLAKWSRSTVRERYEVRCLNCDTTISEGSSVRDYFEINLVGAPADTSTTEKDTTHG